MRLTLLINKETLVLNDGDSSLLPEWIRKLHLGDSVMQETVYLRCTLVEKTLCQ